MVDGDRRVGAPRMMSPAPSPRMLHPAGDRVAELAAGAWRVLTNVTMFKPE